MPKQSSGLLDLGGTLMNTSKPVFREYVISLLVGERVVCSRLHAQIKTRMTQYEHRTVIVGSDLKQY